MSDEIILTLNSPLTEKDWDMIEDVDFEHTNTIMFHTKNGKEVEFVKLTDALCWGCNCPKMPYFKNNTQKKGKWIDTQPNLPDISYKKDGMSYMCSCCGHSAGKYKHKTYKFCPWCGADMRGDVDD